MTLGGRVGVGLEVHPRLDHWAQAMGAVARKQLPFASSVALTRTARDCADAIRADAPKRFRLRSQWIVKGIGSTRALKIDWPHPRASVYAGWHPRQNRTDDFLELQEAGGRKRPKRGRFVYIPMRGVRRLQSDKISKANRAWTLIGNNKAREDFEHRVVRRTGKAQGAIGRLNQLYLMRKSVDIHPRFGLQRTVKAAFAANYRRRFFVALDDAIKTPKPKKKVGG